MVCVLSHGLCTLSHGLCTLSHGLSVCQSHGPVAECVHEGMRARSLARDDKFRYCLEKRGMV